MNGPHFLPGKRYAIGVTDLVTSPPGAFGFGSAWPVRDVCRYHRGEAPFEEPPGSYDGIVTFTWIGDEAQPNDWPPGTSQANGWVWVMPYTTSTEPPCQPRTTAITKPGAAAGCPLATGALVALVYAIAQWFA